MLQKSNFEKSFSFKFDVFLISDDSKLIFSDYLFENLIMSINLSVKSWNSSSVSI